MRIAELLGRKVEFFRAHIEPGILAMPKNALHHTDKDIAEMSMTEIGVFVRTSPGKVNGTEVPGREFIVPYSNCQTVRLIVENKTIEDGLIDALEFAKMDSGVTPVPVHAPKKQAKDLPKAQ